MAAGRGAQADTTQVHENEPLLAEDLDVGRVEAALGESRPAGLSVPRATLPSKRPSAIINSWRVIMISDLVWALIAALILAIVGIAFAKPRTLVASWVRGVIRRVQLRLYLQHREDTQRAIERIAAHLTQRLCDEEGNPDDEYRSDLYRWFTGDAEANVDYSRKQERDLERLNRGDFRRR